MRRAGMVLAMAAAAGFLAPPAYGADSPGALDTARPAILVTGQKPRPIQPNAFGTRTLDGGVTLYDARFRRVSRTDRDHPLVERIAARLRGLSPESQLALAKQEVERRVMLTSDRDNLGVADLWLNAGETLESGRGDDEDIAIAQMQVLKASGFPAQDLYLTLGTEKGAEPHFVLLARTARGYYMLDHDRRGPVLVDAAAVFRPMVSVGVGKSWVHGYPVRRGSARLQTASR